MFSSKQKEEGCKEIKSPDQSLELRWTGEKKNGRLFKKSSLSYESITSKKVGLKLKDRNRKRKNIESDIENSTEHVQKHVHSKSS